MIRRWLASLPALSLRVRLVGLLSGVIFFVLLGQTMLELSREIGDLDHHVDTRGTIMAQGVASACSDLVRSTEPARFDQVFALLASEVDLVEASVADTRGVILGHTDPDKVGTLEQSHSLAVFSMRRTPPGLSSLAEGSYEYLAEAPVLQGSMVIGSVRVRYRSDEVTRRARSLMQTAVIVASIWLVVGAVGGSLYLRRITRPLEDLTLAAITLRSEGLGKVEIPPAVTFDEVGLLQRSLAELVDALRKEKVENERLMAEQVDMNAHLQEMVDDVTADLRESAEYLQAVIHSLEEGVVTCDRTGTLVQASQSAFIHLWGIGDPQPGSRIDELIPDQPGLAEAVRLCQAHARSERLELTYPPPEPDGPPRVLVFRISPLVNNTPNPIGTVITVVDETRQRAVESRLRRHDRLISLGTIAAGLAHELGNYMHAIHGFTTVVERQLGPDDPMRPDVEAIRDENAQAIDLLDRFLQFARPAEEFYSEESVDELVRCALKVCDYRLRKHGIDVRQALDAEEPIRVDARLLQQVFVNLILNATDAMADADEKVLAIRSAFKGQDSVELAFRDTGCGMTPEVQARIFDPFYTTKETGTGLGLSISHQVVARHGGQLRVSSRVGAGTVFTIVLPARGPRREEEE